MNWVKNYFENKKNFAGLSIIYAQGDWHLTIYSPRQLFKHNPYGAAYAKQVRGDLTDDILASFIEDANKYFIGNSIKE